MISFSHMIFYVKSIDTALVFYQEAFGITPQFVHESGEYAELSTGDTTLAFASEALGNSNLSDGYTKNDITSLPSGCEIVFSTKDVHAAFEQAIKNGGIEVAQPMKKPWGQLVAYVRDPNGLLIEIASPMN